MGFSLQYLSRHDAMNPTLKIKCAGCRSEIEFTRAEYGKRLECSDCSQRIDWSIYPGLDDAIKDQEKAAAQDRERIREAKRAEKVSAARAAVVATTPIESADAIVNDMLDEQRRKEIVRLENLPDSPPRPTRKQVFIDDVSFTAGFSMGFGGLFGVLVASLFLWPIFLGINGCWTSFIAGMR